MAETPIQFPPAPMTVRDQIQVRAEHSETRNKIFLMHDERRWTYRRFRDEAARMAHFLLGRLGRSDAAARPPHVAMLLENHLELVSLYGGCAVAGATLFGINTGLRGETLAGVINHARARLLVVDDKLVPEVERVRAQLATVPAENVLTLSELREALEREVGSAEKSLAFPDADVRPETNLMVIYTSGTTGLPKGINNNHLKLCATGIGVSANTGMHRDDTGYACMPLFHSNSMFVGLMPAFWVGGSIGLRERFSGSRFVPDCFEYGVSCWNYVGEPVHYVLAAIEREHGGDPARIRREVTEHPKNRLRFAVGNGASPVDIDRFVEWLGLEDMFELYGSTEAAISTMRRKGDPRGSVGQILDPAVKILDERGKECEPAVLRADGGIANYDAAVGEICRIAPETGLFQGYFDNPDANSSKYRDGIYHSGDLGHVLVQDGKRFLYFDGRTDDWIRKDGENFSALQVARLLSEHPDVPLAAAYGVPCAVSDELVMAALKLREGAEFDPVGFFDFCEKQIRAGGMDRKWFPDFVRIVRDFEYTGTQKVLVRELKRVHFDPRRVADPIFFRERGDTRFRPLGPAEYEKLRETFRASERLHLLERG
jgi:fatty-acyl-CoA synthase